ncbi:MAG: hypothetical protein JWN76_3465 [Chitinophagaceae bacterium]|nr:hypothetical protein [Chitinophagaceae bacterium]
MKKVLTLATAVLLVSGLAFAGDNKKPKKAACCKDGDKKECSKGAKACCKKDAKTATAAVKKH